MTFMRWAWLAAFVTFTTVWAVRCHQQAEAALPQHTSSPIVRRSIVFHKPTPAPTKTPLTVCYTYNHGADVWCFVQSKENE